MLRKSRSGWSSPQSGRRASRQTEGSRSTDEGSSNSGDDSFDPFESFDAHDRAASLGSQRGQFKGARSKGANSSNSADGRSGDSDFPDTAGSAEPAEFTEAVYSRSRRTPGEAKPAQDDDAKKSNRPVRTLKGRALGYLSRREYSRSELARKLKPFVEETDSLDSLLDSLEAENWLSNSRFAESLLHRRSSRLGAGRIVGELKQHGVDPELVEEASAQLRETELARAQAVWSKKFRGLPESPAERAKQARFLASRGFSGATIGKILKGLDEE
ncbi:recombination regulator RecX [Paraburkholderia sp. BCC1886]|uniref:recombination regulator RecX n=1 Tax=Paraburkholderia sp. BCC1886 TaxID=2562670 RepID=UPI0011839B76|nr:recombination regulator RecX [Paraburkholderia sp. BCC1886]